MLIRPSVAGILVAAVFIIPCVSTFAAHAASFCRTVSYAGERTKLQRIMTSNEYSREERKFILAGVEERLKEIQKNHLNAKGADCGIQAVRAHILGCMNSTLPSVLVSARSTGQGTGTVQWGKRNVTDREAVAIGMLHACRANAMKAFTNIR